MSFDAARLYELLPAIYRLRDAALGGPLQALLGVLADQVAVVEENLAQLYDDQFIETCADQVVPYIGDLIGYRPVHGVAPKVVSARAEVAHTIGFRRRKGTAAVLEQLARDVTGWDAQVVEFFLLLATTQYMNHLRPGNFYAPDLRQWEALERLNSPFDRIAHTADVRSIARVGGLYNIPNIGIFLWRLSAYSLTDASARSLDGGRWWFSPLGRDTPLVTRPQTADEVTQLAGRLNVPVPISRRILDAYLPDYYGQDRSLFLRVDGQDIPVAAVECCDLSDVGGGAWAHRPPAGRIAIDPVLGRIAFPQGETHTEVLVLFHYGFSADLGGGEYERESTFDDTLSPVDQIQAPASLQSALTARRGGGAVEIEDSKTYAEALSITLDDGVRLEVRAANKKRPLLVPAGWPPAGSDWPIRGGFEVTLSGLVLYDFTLHVPAGVGGPSKLRLLHCTLGPGARPSLVVESANVSVEIDHCIVGGLRLAAGSTATITDSIVDATGQTEVAYAAVAGTGDTVGGPLSLERCTVIGKVHTAQLLLASNSIFLADLAQGDTWKVPVQSEQRQTGCVRYSYLPPSALVPRRFRCQPRSDDEASRGFGCPAPGGQPPTPADALRVRPRFTSLAYGQPGYCQLSPRCADEIRRGADDEAEMGAFHDLFQPQRESNLRVRLDEYLRFRLEAGIFYTT
jgi:hypothetical protein